MLQNGLVEAQPSNPLAQLLNFIDKTVVIAEVEARKIRHDPTEILTRAVQPALWLLVFGEVFTQVHAIPTGNLPYIDFMAPGILAQSVLFIAIFSGITLIWERDLGIIHKFLASPIPRSALVTGKALAAGVKALAQGLIIYVLAVLLGVHINWNIFAILGTLLVVILGAMLFSTFSLIIACLVKTRERFMGIGQLMTMPLFFASNAIYPVSIMPGWLQVLARINPLSYQVDVLRSLMLGQPSQTGIGLDFVVMVVATFILISIATRLYPSAAT
ncbi:MAG TPA: ABC transporter permease [Phototrophicaceae bacterium]|nr:ABC transporter permease [Phototrophicaceae bacterium]